MNGAYVCGARRVWVCVSRREQVGDGSVFVRGDGDVGGGTPAIAPLAESGGRGGSGPAGQVISSLHSNGGHSRHLLVRHARTRGRLRWEKCHAPLRGVGGACLCDLQPPSQQVRCSRGEARTERVQLRKMNENTVCENTCLIYASFKRW